MIPIFCINLERATERKKYIQKEWIDKLGFDIIFWKAYDRRDVEQNNIIYPYDKNLAIKMIGRELNTGEIACTTSFCMLYEYCLSNNINEILIIEDDAIPTNETKKVFEYISVGKQEFPNSHIFLLFEPQDCFFKKNIPSDLFYQKKDIFSLCKIAPWGNQFIYLTKEGIIALYETLKTMSMPSDKPHQKLLCDLQMVSLINIPLVKHCWVGKKANSYIQNDYRNTNRKFIK
jgi:GR25 family glycosyltransferase involved in LPS biosynthesis